MGSTVGLTDSSANLVEQTSYDSFGNHTASGRTRYTYTGRERDADTGLMYYRARFYDPQLGRFVAEDPIGFGGGANWYAYVANSPLAFSDPLGLCKDPQKPSKDDDPETPCMTRTEDVKRDITDISKMLGGQLGSDRGQITSGQRYPSSTIEIQGKSFNDVDSILTQNGFKPATFLGFYSFRHPNALGYQKQFSDNLWYHVVVEFPTATKWVFRGHEASSREPDFSTPPSGVSVHCHGTDPTGLTHLRRERG